MLIVVLLQSFVGLVLALLLLRNSKGSVFLRALFFFPTILSSAAVAFIWNFVYDPSGGLITTVLDRLGLEYRPALLGSPQTALVFLALVQVWFHAGQMMVVFIAGLQQIPRDYLEAAAIDGANRWQTFRRVTWPLLGPATAIVVAYTTLQSFRVFDLVYIMTEGGPLNSTRVLGFHIYRTAFEAQFYGEAATESVLFMALIAAVTFLLRRALRPDRCRRRRERGMTGTRRLGIPSRVLLAVCALLIVVPLAVVMFGSFKTQREIIVNPIGPPAPPNVQGYRDVASENIVRALGNSVMVVTASVIITVLVSSFAAFAVTRLGGWRSVALLGFFTLGMAVPAQVNGIQQYALFKDLGLTNSRTGLVLVNIAVTLPVATFILSGFMRTVPKDLFEAAIVDGARTTTLYWRIVVPLSAPAIATVAIFLMVMHWNDLYYPLLFLTDESKWTLPRTLTQLRGEFLTNYPALFAGVTIASMPMVVAYVFMQRWFVAGLTSGAVKG